MKTASAMVLGAAIALYAVLLIVGVKQHTSTWDYLWSVEELPRWLRAIQALGVVAIAVFGAFIAYRQWLTAHEKLRLDLFEKRWLVYAQANNFWMEVMRNFDPDYETMSNFWANRNQARYLFGPDVNTLLERAHNIAYELRSNAASRIAASGELKQSLMERRAVLEKQFAEMFETLPGSFDRYLSFKEVAEKR